MNFRLARTEQDEWRAAAAEQGITVSELIRDSVRRTLTASASADELRDRQAS